MPGTFSPSALVTNPPRQGLREAEKALSQVRLLRPHHDDESDAMTMMAELHRLRSSSNLTGDKMPELFRPRPRRRPSALVSPCLDESSPAAIRGRSDATMMTTGLRLPR
jgi:hypothetical protein